MAAAAAAAAAAVAVGGGAVGESRHAIERMWAVRMCPQAKASRQAALRAAGAKPAAAGTSWAAASMLTSLQQLC